MTRQAYGTGALTEREPGVRPPHVIVGSQQIEPTLRGAQRLRPIDRAGLANPPGDGTPSRAADNPGLRDGCQAWRAERSQLSHADLTGRTMTGAARDGQRVGADLDAVQRTG